MIFNNLRTNRHKDLIISWAVDSTLRIEREDINIDVGTVEWVLDENPTWAEHINYRARDPYKELEEAVNNPAKEIRRVSATDGYKYPWRDNFSLKEIKIYPASNFEIRDTCLYFGPTKKSVTEQVNLFAFYILSTGHLMYTSNVNEFHKSYALRVPEEDKLVRVIK